MSYRPGDPSTFREARRTGLAQRATDCARKAAAMKSLLHQDWPEPRRVDAETSRAEPTRKMRFIPHGQRPQLEPEEGFKTVIPPSELRKSAGNARRERDAFDSAIRRACCYLFVFFACVVIGCYGWRFAVEFVGRGGRP